MLTAEKGTYILILKLDHQTHLTVGKLGEFTFEAGWFTYVGSAFGSGGLRGRLNHHLAPIVRPHWHIDYLRSAAPVVELWFAVSDRILEHVWADALQRLPGASIPAPRFGASDCTCAAHLLAFMIRPDFDAFRQMSGDPAARKISAQLDVSKSDT